MYTHTYLQSTHLPTAISSTSKHTIANFSVSCRALSKQRTDASQLHQRLLRHAAAELGERPAAQRKAAAAAVRGFANTYFTCQDFANSQHASHSLDNIMCLSVTKWVHLNQGDEGLKRLFGKVADALAPGGWFILEPQPWRSYKQARRKQVTYTALCLLFHGLLCLSFIPCVCICPHLAHICNATP